MSGGTTARSSFSFTLNRDTDRAAVDSIMERARVGEWATRLASRDTTLWSDDSAVQEKIAHRLGWIDAPNRFTEQIPALEAFGEKIRAAGFTTAIVAGMGGNAATQTLAIMTYEQAFGFHRMGDSLGAVIGPLLGLLIQDIFLYVTFTIRNKIFVSKEVVAFIADFIDMLHEEHRDAVLQEFRKQLARDRVKTMTGDFTSLGLLEMTRKRTRECFHERACERACGRPGLD